MKITDQITPEVKRCVKRFIFLKLSSRSQNSLGVDTGLRYIPKRANSPKLRLLSK